MPRTAAKKPIHTAPITPAPKYSMTGVMTAISIFGTALEAVFKSIRSRVSMGVLTMELRIPRTNVMEVILRPMLAAEWSASGTLNWVTIQDENIKIGTAKIIDVKN